MQVFQTGWLQKGIIIRRRTDQSRAPFRAAASRDAKTKAGDHHAQERNYADQ